MAAQPHFAVDLAPAQFLRKPSKLSMWLNDVDGDCVTAEEAFKCACHETEIFISDDEVRRWATSRGVLNGAFLPDVMGMMHKRGFQQSGLIFGDGQHVGVEWTDPLVLQNAIWKGPVKIGVAADQLQNAVPDPPVNGWVAKGFTLDENYDHCVSLCGYGPLGWLATQLGGDLLSDERDSMEPCYAMFTWSSIGIIDRPSMLAITGEAWLRTPNMTITQP
jgi:hypothetical protein